MIEEQKVAYYRAWELGVEKAYGYQPKLEAYPV